MADIIKEIPSFEPMVSNRWVIRIDGTTQKIPEYVIKDFKLETELIREKNKRGSGWGKEKTGLKLTIHLYNTTHFLLVPDDVICANKIKLQFLDPTGVMINQYNMKVELDKMTLVGDYGSNDLLTHEVSFWVKDLDTLERVKDDEKKKVTP